MMLKVLKGFRLTWINLTSTGAHGLFIPVCRVYIHTHSHTPPHVHVPKYAAYGKLPSPPPNPRRRRGPGGRRSVSLVPAATRKWKPRGKIICTLHTHTHTLRLYNMLCHIGAQQVAKKHDPWLPNALSLPVSHRHSQSEHPRRVSQRGGQLEVVQRGAHLKTSCTHTHTRARSVKISDCQSQTPDRKAPPRSRSIGDEQKPEQDL